MSKFKDGDKGIPTWEMTNPNWTWVPDGSMPGDTQLYAEFFMLQGFGKLLHWESLKYRDKHVVTLEFTIE